MNADKLLQYLEPVISTCPLWEGKNVRVVIIANPNAGGFTQKKLRVVHESTLAEFCALSESKKRLCVGFSGAVFCTEYAGQAAVFAQKTAEEALCSPEMTYVLVSAGGDGTGLEIQTALARLVFEGGEKSAEYVRVVKERITVLRLPFGTGNDGSDGRTLRETLERLVLPAHFALQRAVRVYFTGQTEEKNHTDIKNKKHSDKNVHYESLSSNPPWYAFNIASIGIDAFIAHMTNHTKGFLPGNFYKLWIDLACLFYDFRFPGASAKITAYDGQGNVTEVVNTAFLFCLMGSSGHRTYGCNQKILPDDRNVCLARQMNLIRKLLIKEQFKAGKHAASKHAVIFDAEKLVIEYNQDILTQLDGEIHYIEAERFPLVFERTKPVIRIVELDSAPYYKGAERL